MVVNGVGWEWEQAYTETFSVKQFYDVTKENIERWNNVVTPGEKSAAPTWLLSVFIFIFQSYEDI